MSPAPLPRDVVAEAQDRLARAKEELEAAREQARGARTPPDWLADRPDLLRCQHLIDDLPARRAAFSLAEQEYEWAYQTRLGEKVKVAGLASGEVELGYRRYRWLHDRLKTITTRKGLESLLDHPCLDDANKEIITARLQSLRSGPRWISFAQITPATSPYPVSYLGNTPLCWDTYVRLVDERLRELEQERAGLRCEKLATVCSEVENELGEWKAVVAARAAALDEAEAALPYRAEISRHVACRADAFVTDRTRDRQAAYDASVRAAEEARRGCISAFQRRLALDFPNARVEDFAPPSDHALRRQLEEMRDKHVKEAHEAEEREWWAQALTHPIDEVIEKLAHVPREHTDRVLDLLLNLPADDPHLLDQRVHDFLRREHSRLGRDPARTAPVLVAHAGFLIGQGEHEAARELLDRLPATTQSTPDGVVAYFRFVLREPMELSGATEFDTLAPEDLFLAACYYNSGPALDTLRKQSEWDYKTLSYALSASGGHELSDFQVRGLQPRIAELSFRSVYARLCHRGEKPTLRDLNVEVVKALGRPWRLTSRPGLPSADWEAPGGREYDVKCNLFYRSKQAKLGLRGFLINKSSGLRSFPAFLFTGSDTRSGKWTYLGEYHPPVTSKSADDRVLPFYFRLPDSERFALSTPSCNPALGRRLLCNHRLRLGWQLATGLRLPPDEWPRNDAPARLLYALIDSCVRVASDTFLEHALWRALTEATLKACGEQPRKTVEAFLDLADSLIADRALPVSLPRIDGRPLLCRWVAEVLRPLVENWSSIRWPGCGRCGERAGTPRLQITGMTSEGTIYGRMTCEGCLAELGGNVTLLTHCHKCAHYPLIIGRNPTCIRCSGLVCEYAEGGSQRCKCCKTGCSHGQITPEADFIEGTEERKDGLTAHEY